MSAADEDAFRCALMTMLLRYQSLSGGGFQCALPPPVFACLRARWGVSCEGFASPLNCSDVAAIATGGLYCSAFEDVDAPFGSQGSFFRMDARRIAGSFELNPPFSAELYAALINRCHDFLATAEADGRALSFALVIGATAPALQLPSIASLPQSPYFRGRLVVGVADHAYVCGRQHMQPRPKQFRACDTGVFFLQSSAGALEWPVTDAGLADLRAAFGRSGAAQPVTDDDAEAPFGVAEQASDQHRPSGGGGGGAPPDMRTTVASASRYLTPESASFAACLGGGYAGFVHEPAASLPAKLHVRFRRCLRGVQSDGLLARHDVTQPMGTGTRLAQTRVTRCLIGKAGITYRYLGLRMFSHPWNGPSASAACKLMAKLSLELERRAVSPGGAHEGSSGFNLCLLNRMVPDAARDSARDGGRKPKMERDFGMGPVSVSWHADSSLEDYSAISVYVAHHSATRDNFEADGENGDKGHAPSMAVQEHEAQPWRVALRVVHDAEGPGNRAAAAAGQPPGGRRDDTMPALLLPLRDGDVYHMVNDFNHHHQHAVIQPDPIGPAGAEAAAGTVRYSSTHRVAAEEGATFSSVHRRSMLALATAADEEGRLAGGATLPAADASSASTAGPASEGGPVSVQEAQWREEQACLDELEFEWLRQWYIQGSVHREGHPWWHTRIARLEEAWLALERLTLVRMGAVRASLATASACAGSETTLLARVLHDVLSRRQRLRSAWAQRERDPLFESLDDGYHPLPCLHDTGAPHLRANDTAMPGASRVPLTGTLPGELSNAVDELAQLLAAASRHVADGVSERHAGDCVSAPPPRVQLNPGNRKRSRGDTESSRQS